VSTSGEWLLRDEARVPAAAGKTKLYFPNLNSLRFFAAATVIVSHVEQYKCYFGQPYICFPIDWGGLAVTLFFVLSGFLITYLLLTERKLYRTVSVRSFYVRRILRIWPLYYLIAVLALFVLPHVATLQMPGISEHLARHYWWKVGFILTLFPNLALAAFMEVPYAAQLWSVGVEEQFYLVWPVVLKFTRRLAAVLVGIAVVVTLLSNGLLRGAVVALNARLGWLGPEVAADVDAVLTVFLENLRISCMAIGGLAAYVHFKEKRRWLAFLYFPGVQWAAYGAIIWIMLAGRAWPHEVYALLFAVIILNLACNPRSVVHLECRSLAYLGNISYGIYMWHPLGVVLAIRLMLFIFGGVHGLSRHLLAHVFAQAISIAMAAASYHLYERRFLKMKDAFARIVGARF